MHHFLNYPLDTDNLSAHFFDCVSNMKYIVTGCGEGAWNAPYLATYGWVYFVWGGCDLHGSPVDYSP